METAKIQIGGQTVTVSNIDELFPLFTSGQNGGWAGLRDAIHQYYDQTVQGYFTDGPLRPDRINELTDTALERADRELFMPPASPTPPTPPTWEEKTEAQEAGDPYGVFQRHLSGVGLNRSPFLMGLAERRYGDLNTLYNTMHLGSKVPTAEDPGPPASETFEKYLGKNNPFTGYSGTQTLGMRDALQNIVAALGLNKLTASKAWESPHAAMIRERFGADPETGRFSGLGQAFLQPTLGRIAPAFRKAFRRGALGVFQDRQSRNPGGTAQEFYDMANQAGYLK